MTYFAQLSPLIFGISIFLVATFAFMSCWAGIGYFRLTRKIGRVTAKIEEVPQPSALVRRGGLRPADFSMLSESLEGDPDAYPWWHTIRDSLEQYEPVSGGGGSEVAPSYFLMTPLQSTLTSDAVLGHPTWARFYRILPGVITSGGLFGTFLALMLGLQGVRVDKETVTGIDILINNLSGKFLTSLVAIVLSVLALVIEGGLHRGMAKARQRLFSALDARLPYLTPNRILLELKANAIQQSHSLSNISSDFAIEFGRLFTSDIGPKLASSVSTSMAAELQSGLGPTLISLHESLVGLSATVSQLESSKTESVVGEVHGLTASLGESLQRTLASMGDQFREALSASTRDEFSRLGETVSASSGVLNQVMEGLSGLQQSLEAVAENTRSSTQEQTAASLAHSERLNLLVEALMTRLNDAAAQNVSSIGATLTHVVTELSAKVSSLGDEVARSVATASSRTNEASQSVLAQANNWTQQTGEQLARVLEGLHSQSETFRLANQGLLDARASLKAVLEQSQGSIEAMAKAASSVQAYSVALAGVQEHVRRGQEAQANLATRSGESVVAMEAITRSQDELLTRYQGTIREYQEVIGSLDRDLKRVLEMIGDGLDRYARASEKSFEAVVQTTNRLFPNIADTLKDSNERLGVDLEDLSASIRAAVDRLTPQ